MNYSISDHSFWFRQQALNSYCVEQVIARARHSANASSVFWLGYQTAIQKLFSTLLQGNLAALVVNEKRQSSPKYWSSRVVQGGDGIEMSGHKDFVTAIDQIDTLLVTVVNACSAQNTSSHLPSSLVLLDKDAQGLMLQTKTMPILKALDKKSCQFEKILIEESQLISMTAYDEYVKPFRFIEDFYVSVAFNGYLEGIIESIINMLLDIPDPSLLPVKKLQQAQLHIAEHNRLAVECYEQEMLLAYEQKQWPSLRFEQWLEVGHSSFIETLKWLMADTGEAVTKTSNASFKEVHQTLTTLQQDSAILAIGQKARTIRLQRAVN